MEPTLLSQGMRIGLILLTLLNISDGKPTGIGITLIARAPSSLARAYFGEGAECDQNGSARELRLWDSNVANLKEITMSNQTNPPKLVNPRTLTEIEKLEDLQKLDRVANDAAERAGKTEQRYDQDHDIFTK